MEALPVLAVAALVVTKLVDTLRNALDPNGKWPKWLWNVAAFGIGLAVALIYGLNGLANLGDIGRVQITAGRVITGIMLGAGAGVWHEVLDAASGIAKRGHV